MPTLRPTSGTTSCMIYLGQFSWTYDGSTSTICMFREGTCISEWYWDIPVKVTKFNIFSRYYSPDSRITGIWGRVGAGWFLLWGYGEWNPSHAAWDSKAISCDNCDGIRISQVHALQTLKSGIAEVSVDYELDDFTLDEALTCLWVNGYNDHGPLVTEFDLDQLVYAYTEIHGPDMYGHTARHEWWYKEAGATEFTKRWEYNWTCGGHYTEWAQWTWWKIGGSYGPGEGYIAVYFDDVFLGKTNNYTILGCIGEIHSDTVFKYGPFNTGTAVNVIDPLVISNIGNEYGLINWAIYEEGNPTPLATDSIGLNGGTYHSLGAIPLTPDTAGDWKLCLTVWSILETEPTCVYLELNISNTRNKILRS